MAAKKVILVIGYIDMDFYMTTPRLPDEGESLEALSYSFSPGGKGANAAVAAFRSSHVRRPGADDTSPEFDSAFTEIDIDVSMIGAVGDDANGDLAKKNLVQNGVDISKVRTFDGLNTGICFCMIESGTGENRLLFTTGATRQLGSADFETVEQLCTSDGRRPDLIISQLEVQVRAVEQMLQTAHEASIDVVLNAAPASQIDLDAYEWITHLIVNETEAAILAGRPVKMVNSETWYDIAEEFLKDGVKNVVITLAAQGAYYANQKGHGLVPAKSVTVADATGAGQVPAMSPSKDADKMPETPSLAPTPQNTCARNLPKSGKVPQTGTLKRPSGEQMGRPLSPSAKWVLKPACRGRTTLTRLISTLPSILTRDCLRTRETADLGKRSQCLPGRPCATHG